MSWQLYFGYIATCFVVTIVPGPNVALVVGNSLKHGTRASLLNVLGTQLGMVVWLGIAVLGLVSIVAAIGDWLKYVGVILLLWIAWELWHSSSNESPVKPRGGFVWQGFRTILSNPKALGMIAGVIPAFIDPNANYVLQILLLGATLMAVGALTDSCYAIFASWLRPRISQRWTRLISRASACILVGFGVGLALTRTR